MSYSSQRYDLDAAAAKRRSESFSQNNDHRKPDARHRNQHYTNRGHDHYYRAPNVSRSPSYSRVERPYTRGEERPQSRRQDRPRHEERSHQERQNPRTKMEEGNTFLNSSQASQVASRASTYSTYILPLKSQGEYRTADPTRCTCNCCPHPMSIAHNHNNHRRTPDMRHNGTKSRRNKCNSEGRYLIQVKDKSTGSLNRENGPSYPISLNPRTSCDRIASFLAPDRRHAKVIVHWDDGRMENLGKQIPMDELIRHAEYLEVKEVKRVHWAA
ncbi:uncharacterized protein FTOL_05322 [Fusarium torulosum]|uniref:Uncharacterized protein n=1 Tax=Fusarium torulosum TaxID=33205 RepID=A0AAE8M722_9HYPO|nr:uncharacterized protein FTOL_05322 [Fusarium torulosum]